MPSTLSADWLAAYGEFVPAGNLFATCFDVCEFSYFDAPRGNHRCPSLTYMRKQEFWDRLHAFSIDDSVECTDGFDKRVEAHVLPSMPLYPGVCILRPSAPSGKGEVTNPFVQIAGGLYPVWPGYVVVYNREPPLYSASEYSRALSVEIHELCHTNQFWHFLEQMQPDRLTDGSLLSTAAWRTTKPGSSFIDLAGFSQDDTGEWSLPDDTTFTSIIYGLDDPFELSAELCMLYFVNRMGKRSDYGENFDPTRYLTDEIVEWIETWVALPEIAEG